MDLGLGGRAAIVTGASRGIGRAVAERLVAEGASVLAVSRTPGVGPGEPDWGRQLSDARDLLGRNWAAAVVPGVLIIVTAAAINLLGDWAQERFERRGSGR